MTWSYSGDPSSSDLDTVRFLIADTDTTEQKISNEEIAFLLVDWEDDVYNAAAAAAEQLAASASSWLSYTADGVTLSLSDVQAKYLLLADTLRMLRARRNPPAPYAGGIDRGDVEAHKADESVTHGEFALHMHDNDWEGYQGGASRKDLLGEGHW